MSEIRDAIVKMNIAELREFIGYIGGRMVNSRKKLPYAVSVVERIDELVVFGGGSSHSELSPLI